MDLMSYHRDRVFCCRPIDFSRITYLRYASLSGYGMVFSPWNFVGVAGACQNPNSSSFLGETRSLQVSDFCPKGMTSFLTIYPKSEVL